MPTQACAATFDEPATCVSLWRLRPAGYAICARRASVAMEPRIHYVLLGDWPATALRTILLWTYAGSIMLRWNTVLQAS